MRRYARRHGESLKRLLIHTAGHSEHPTQPTLGSVGCLEHQWRAAAALPWRSRGEHWHSASVRLEAESSGANPGGLGGFGSLQRHRNKGSHGTPRCGGSR